MLGVHGVVVSDGDEGSIINQGDDHQKDHRKGEESRPLVVVVRWWEVFVVLLGVESEHGNKEEGE